MNTLRRNTLTGKKPRLPEVDDTRVEVELFLAGVEWTIDQMTGYKCKYPDIVAAARDYINAVYPKFDPPGEEYTSLARRLKGPGTEG